MCLAIGPPPRIVPRSAQKVAETAPLGWRFSDAASRARGRAHPHLDRLVIRERNPVVVDGGEDARPRRLDAAAQEPVELQLAARGAARARDPMGRLAGRVGAAPIEA